MRTLRQLFTLSVLGLMLTIALFGASFTVGLLLRLSILAFNFGYRLIS